MSSLMKLHKARWLASYPKSGNTWVRLFLDAYLLGRVDINNILSAVSDTRRIEYQVVCPVAIDELTESVKLNYRNAALMNMIIRSSPRPAIFKTHNAQETLYDIQLIPTDMTLSAVYLIRDPNDVAASLAAHLDESIEDAIEGMNDYGRVFVRESGMAQFVSTWSEHVKSWQSGAVNTLIVRYEDLKADPAYWFKAILDKYEIPVNEFKLKRAIDMCSMEKLRLQELEYGFSEKFHKQKSLFFGGERSVLTQKQREQIERDHEDVINQFYARGNYERIQR